MVQFARTKSVSLGLTSGPNVFVLVVAFSLTACGSGSDDAAVKGPLTLASTTVVSGTNENSAGRASPPGQARRAVLYDPLVNSTNPATKRHFAVKCARQATLSPGIDKVRYGASTRPSLRQSACAAIAAR